MNNKTFSRNQITTNYPWQQFYVADYECQRWESGNVWFLVVHTKTGEKSKYGGDIYADNKKYFRQIGVDKYILNNEGTKPTFVP